MWTSKCSSLLHSCLVSRYQNALWRGSALIGTICAIRRACPHPLLPLDLCRNKEKIDKITSSLKLKVSVRDSKMGDPRAHVFAICSQWLPLARAVLEMVTRKLPSPLEVSEARAERLMCDSTKTFDSLPPSTQELKNGE